MNLRLTILFLSLSVSANAQYWYSQEISVGYGIVPSDQFLDGNRNAAGAGYISYENFKVSGMWFVNYKFFVGEKFSIGLFAGREQESGTMGAPYDSDEPVMPLGTFSRTAYTIASEISVQYRSERNTRIYATAGIGVTIEQETDVFQQAYYNNARQYLNYSGPLTGSETIVPNNRTHFNGYISPVGISVGNHLRGFFEIGFGYKGIFNGGISYYFCKGKKKPIELMTLDPGDVVILPHNYPIGKELKQIKEVWSGNRHFDRFTDFDKELDQMKRKTKYAKGNVLRIDKISDINKGLYYQVRGEIFYTSDLNALKKEIENKKNNRCDTCNYARLILYRPSTGHGPIVRLNINDTSEIELFSRDKYVYKIRQEGEYKISGTGGKIVLINVRFGGRYYIKVFADVNVPEHKKRRSFKAKQDRAKAKVNKYMSRPVLMDNMQGELESCLAKKNLIMELGKGLNKYGSK